MMASRIVSRLLPVAEGDSMFEPGRLDTDMDLESQEREYGRHFEPGDDDPEAMLYEASVEQVPFRDALSPETRPMARGSVSLAQSQPGRID